MKTAGTSTRGLMKFWVPQQMLRAEKEQVVCVKGRDTSKDILRVSIAKS